MIEVECRTCLEMSDLDNSFSITKKFLLDKSFKEVILLFAPQMVTAIWADDIICLTCSDTLYAFARFIKQIVSVEKVLKNYDKHINDARENRKVGSHFNPNMMINKESIELNSQYEGKKQLQLRPIQETKEGPTELPITGAMEYSHYQCISTSKTDYVPSKEVQIKWAKCRTCLVEMPSEKSATRLTEKFLLNKTFKEVIVCFIPHMVSVSWIDEVICAKCSKILRDFAEFIERCVAIEEIFQKAIVRIEADCRRNNVNSQLNERIASNTNSQLNSERLLPSTPAKDWWNQSKTVQKQQNLAVQRNFNTNKVVRTYFREHNACKPKIKEKSDKEVLYFVIKQEAPKPPFLNATSRNLGEKSTIDCRQNPVEASLPMSIKDYVEIADENEESTKPREAPFDITRDDQGPSHDISTIQLSDTDNKPACSSTAISNSDNMNPTYNPEASIENDKYEAIDTNKQFNVIKGGSICTYPINFHDRVVSFPQSNEVLPAFLEDMSKRNILIYHYGLPKEVKNKRILLLGSAVVPCPICKAEFTHRSLRSHMKTKHDCDLPRFKNDTPYDCVLRPSKKGELHKSGDNTLYIYDYIVKPASGGHTHPCPLCNTITYSNRLLTRHIQRVHKDFKPYRCEKCGKMFRTKKNYNLHVQKFKNYSSCDARKCYVCSEMIGRENFTTHVKSHHSFICGECGFSCLSDSSLKMHTRMHQYEIYKQNCKRTYKQQLCPVCGILATNMAPHMKTHQPRPRKFMCHKCPKCFMTLSGLNLHIKNSHCDETFECKQCKTECRSVHAMREHIKLKHSKTYSHSCKICGQQFSRGDYFTRHMRNHSGYRSCNKGFRKYSYALETSAPVKCKYCPKSFKTIYLLRLHLLTHVKRMRYKCRICSITCSNLQNRHRHENKHKDPNFDLRCKICWNQMKTKEELEKHMEKHEMSRKYKCQHCDEAFARKYLLSHHVSEEHTNEEEVEKEKQAILSAALEEFLLYK